MEEYLTQVWGKWLHTYVHVIVIQRLRRLQDTKINLYACSFCWSGMTNPEVVRHLDKSYRMPCPDGCPDELYDIMMICWKQRPEDRPTFEYLQNTLNDFFIATEGQYEMQPWSLMFFCSNPEEIEFIKDHSNILVRLMQVTQMDFLFFLTQLNVNSIYGFFYQYRIWASEWQKFHTVVSHWRLYFV